MILTWFDPPSPENGTRAGFIPCRAYPGNCVSPIIYDNIFHEFRSSRESWECLGCLKR